MKSSPPAAKLGKQLLLETLPLCSGWGEPFGSLAIWTVDLLFGKGFIAPLQLPTTCAAGKVELLSDGDGQEYATAPCITPSQAWQLLARPTLTPSG